MKLLLLHGFLFIQLLGYASPMGESFVLKIDTLIPEKTEQRVSGTPVPTYPGGDAQLIKDLQNNLTYPKAEKAKGIQGTVMVEFNVEPDGSITDIKVIRSIKEGEKLNDAAIQAVKSLKRFIPYKDYKGESIRQSLTLPVRFLILEENEEKPTN
jgi:TonB family protein